MIDSSHQTLLTQLQQTWHQTIPVSEFMQIAPLAFDGANFEVSAPLEPNINLHQTMFAGSIDTNCIKYLINSEALKLFNSRRMDDRMVIPL